MIYRVILTRAASGRTIERTCDTRADLAILIDECLKRYPKSAGWDYTVTCEVTKRYTLLDCDVTTGEQTQEKLWEFMSLKLYVSLVSGVKQSARKENS